MFTLLKQRRMRWLGHVVRMDDRRIPKDLLYGELVQGKRPTGRPQKPSISTRTTGKQQPSNGQPGDRLCRKVSSNLELAEKSLQVRRDARSAARRKEIEKKGCSPCRQTSVRLQLCPLPQGLSFPHRTGQPHPALYQNKHLERKATP